MNPLNNPLPRRPESQEFEVRLQKSLSPERKALIAQAERFFILQNPKKKPSSEITLGELIDEVLRDWIAKQEKGSVASQQSTVTEK